MKYLQSLDPKLFYTMVSSFVGLLIYIWRKVSLSSWDALTRKSPLLQNLPAIVLSGLLSAAPSIGKDTATVVANIVFGAFFGGAASIVGHHMLKDSPLPYDGGRPPKPPLFPADDDKTPNLVNT